MNGNYRWLWVFLKWLLLLGTPALVLAMFTVQNLDRTTGLSLNLGVGAVELEQAWPVPALLFVTFLGGFLVGEVHARVSAWRSGRAAAGSMSSPRASDDDWV